MTLGELIFNVTRKSAMDDTVPDERTLLVRWANDGVIEVLLETHAVIRPGDITLTIGVPEYTLDANILAAVSASVTSSSQLRDVEIVPIEEIRSRARVGSTSPVTAIAIEGDLMIVYPTPTAADVVRLYYVPRPASVLTSDADDLSSAGFGSLPKEYHRAVEYYMLWQAAEYDDKKVAQAPLDLLKQFEMECGKVRRRKRGKRGRQPLVGRVGYPTTSSAPHRNDQDIR